MAQSRFTRLLGLAVAFAAFLGVFAATGRDAQAVTVVATLVSGGGGGPVGNPDPNVEFLNAANIWQPAAVTTQDPLYAPPFPGSLYIDAPPSAAAPAPNPVLFRTPFTLPLGCISPKLAIDLHADNWADVYLNGPVPPAAANFVGGQPHAAIFANFQNPPESFSAPPPATFVNPGLNWLYLLVENAGGAPTPNNPRALDVRAVVTCDAIIPIPPPTLVYECFDLNAGQDPNQAVLLDTKNFGRDIVGVRTSPIMCETANKFRLPAGTNLPPGLTLPPPRTAEVLQCFRLQKGQDPNDPAVLDTSNFGPDKVQVRVSREMCEAARKLIGGAVKSTDHQQIWQCFDIRDGENPNALVHLVTNNFGHHRAFVGKAVKLCEEATKTTANGQVYNADNQGRVYQCFRLVETPNQAVPATLVTRNFGADEVRVRRANMVCEPARKTILWEHDPNDPAPTGDITADN